MPRPFNWFLAFSDLKDALTCNVLVFLRIGFIVRPEYCVARWYIISVQSHWMGQENSPLSSILLLTTWSLSRMAVRRSTHCCKYPGNLVVGITGTLNE